MLEKCKEAPDICSYLNNDQSKFIIEFTLVSVDKENISLTMNEHGCYLFAQSEDVDYTATFSFFCPVNPLKANASFEEAILTVEVPLKNALKDTVTVPVV